jgi:hypothetical protein
MGQRVDARMAILAADDEQGIILQQVREQRGMRGDDVLGLAQASPRASTTASEICRSASMEKVNRSWSRSPLMPSLPMLNDSSGLVR